MPPPVDKSDHWRINFIKELVDVKRDDLVIPGLEKNELEEIMEYLCNG